MKIFLSIILIAGGITSHANQLEVCRGETGLFGFCNSNGDVVIPQVYYDALEFVNGHAPVLIEDKWGIINSRGEQVLAPRFEEVIECINLENTFLASSDGKWQFIEANGQEITSAYEVKEPRYDFLLNGAVSEITTNEWVAVKKGRKWGAIDILGNEKIDFDYDWLKVILQKVNGVQETVGVVVKEKDKFAWKRADGKAGSGFYFDHFLGMNENQLFFEKGRDLIVLDASSGQKLILEGKQFFRLKNDENKYGLVSAERNQVVVPFKYDIVDMDQIPNHVVFGHHNKVGLSDLWGNVILLPEYKEIKSIEVNPMILAVRNTENKVAVMAVDANRANKVTEFKYQFARKDGESIYIGTPNRHGYLSLDGTETWRD